VSPEDRLALVEAERDRMLAVLERLTSATERLAGVEPSALPVARHPVQRPQCRALTSRHQRRRGGAAS
jgi:hypothetical protein